MAGTITEDYGTEGRYTLSEGMSSQSGDSLAEWRSSEQVENGTPSTSPPFWDTDDDEDDCGPKPSDLYGKFTWKIENFSTINKRELRSNVFEVGGYKWYILIYPQGCDVCNHLSLFLCVANHDKLLPGWSHFAQFTIAVVNREPKKSKYSDTLHRFWKKEHDWGWKKFMELSKVSDGFIVNDTLMIKAQVQVIREKAHRPFRCLDCQYRRELVRVYLSNVEQICRRFVEERRNKICKLIEDGSRWSSFRAFWVGIDQNARRRMSRDKTEAILKVVVKQFFIEKEVTSTLVMDSLYSGLKALECQSKNKKGKSKPVEMEEFPAPMVFVEKDMFVLADDVLKLLDRVASEPLPHLPLPPKDDKGSQNRTKDPNSGDDFNKDTIERDERRLTELGRRTVEIYVLTHIFSRIEVAYQEAVALKRQEELIREEEAAGQAENELKGKRGASEKEKRSKKKQGKQKRSSRKGKDKGRDDGMILSKHIQGNQSDERTSEDFSSKQDKSVLEKIDRLEDASDVSDVGDDASGTLQPDLDERDGNTVNCDTDTSEIQAVVDVTNFDVQIGQLEKRNLSIVDDSSSTCSTDSVPSVVMNGPNKGNSLTNKKGRTSPNRVENHRAKDRHDGDNNLPSDASNDSGRSGDVSASNNRLEMEPVDVPLKDQVHRLEHHPLEKETIVILQKRTASKDQIDSERPSDSRTLELPTSATLPGRKPAAIPQQQKPSDSTTSTTERVAGGELASAILTDKPAPPATKTTHILPIPKSESQKPVNQPAKSLPVHQVSSVSRPSSAPLNPGPKPTAPIISTVQTVPILSRSVSAAGRLGTDPSAAAPSFFPQSYRNAIMGKTSIGASPSGLHSSLSSSSQAASYFQSSVPIPRPQSSIPKEQAAVRPGFTFGSVKPEALSIHPPWRGDASRQEAVGSNTRGGAYDSGVLTNIERMGIYELQNKLGADDGGAASATSSRPSHGMVQDDFPHLDIINDLLDDEHGMGKVANGRRQHHLPFNRQYSFPGDIASIEMGLSEGIGLFDHPAQQCFDDGYHMVYGSPSGALNGPRDAHLQQADISAYPTGRNDGLIQNHWPYTRADLAMLNIGSADGNGYSYTLPDYLNLARSGVPGYMYRPANGH
ncbi:putative coiled-coil protein [Dioscorea alata]|uniref:Coiled-coil protein n=4 Tax=Dioscorea alata TaxID=55571 RepID=A0ACB7ULK3_DIOAL|nr:putative coiled-coil protein [Dioscorea alata]KAH7661280.1 putative coiled-coil protein [Dioscorea alata]KAH7661283.1 putative coiled-coil protein [Dioscorea alata]KAH7661284.1 putative coiled-coil protein [Dioscorea alata]